MNEKGIEILRGLKECVDFVRGSTKSQLNEENPGVILFFIRTEDLLRRGLKQKRNTDYYDFFATCFRKDMDFAGHIKRFDALSEIKTSTGKGRALLRHIASQSILSSFFTSSLIPKLTSTWYSAQAYLRDAGFVEKFIAMATDLDSFKLKFEIRLREIDFSWPFEENLLRVNGKYCLPTDKQSQYNGFDASFNGVTIEKRKASVSNNGDFSELEKKISKLENCCDELEIQLTNKDDELRKTKEEMDYLRQLTIILRSSPDGANTSLSSLECSNPIQEAHLRGANVAALKTETNSAWVDEIMEQQKKLTEEIQSHALLKQAMQDANLELEDKVRQLTEELSSLKSAKNPVKDSKSCQTDVVERADQGTDACEFGDVDFISQQDSDRISILSFGSVTDTKSEKSLVEELEKLGRKYSEARFQIAELQEFKEESGPSGKVKMTPQREKLKNLKVENEELKTRILAVEQEILDKEESFRNVLARNEANIQELHKLQNSLQLRDDDLSLLQSEKSDFARENEILQNSLDSVTKEAKEGTSKVAELESQVKKLTSDNLQLTTENTNLNELVQQYGTDNSKFKVQILNLTDELNCALASAKNQVAAITQERDSIQVLNFEIKRQLMLTVSNFYIFAVFNGKILFC